MPKIFNSVKAVCPQCGRDIELTCVLPSETYEKGFLQYRCSHCNACEAKEITSEDSLSIQRQIAQLTSARERRDRYGETSMGFLSVLSDSGLAPLLLCVVAGGLFGAYGSVGVWTLYLMFILSRLADYVTTQIGLRAGAIETNPASESRKLTGFWSNFLFWSIVYGALSAIISAYPTFDVDKLDWDNKALFLAYWFALFFHMSLGYMAAIHNLMVAFLKVRGSQGTWTVAAVGATVVILLLVWRLPGLVKAIASKM